MIIILLLFLGIKSTLSQIHGGNLWTTIMRVAPCGRLSATIPEHSAPRARTHAVSTELLPWVKNEHGSRNLGFQLRIHTLQLAASAHNRREAMDRKDIRLIGHSRGKRRRE